MKGDWRNHLTDAEREEIASLESRSIALKQQRIIVTAMLNVVRNRAVKRATAAAKAARK